MSFMTMNMSALPIWGSKSDTEMKVAREAGWSRADLIWERVTERALQAWSDSSDAQARKVAHRSFVVADLIARVCFSAGDLRRAASAANLSLSLSDKGRAAAAEAQQVRALQVWAGAKQQIDGMTILPRSRSSLFHLRMEALHRDTYHGNLRTRIGKFAAETEETLRALTGRSSNPHRHYARWRGEKPTVFDDTRKVLSACLMIADR